MKKSITIIAALTCIFAGIGYINIVDQGPAIKIEQSATKNESKLKLETNGLQIETNITQELTSKVPKVDAVVDSSRRDVYSSFEQMLEGMSQWDKERYLKINNQLFGVLNFSDIDSYKTFLDQGFPSTIDIDYVEEQTRKDLSYMVFNNVGSYPNYAKDSSLNLPAVSALNLIKNIEELEIQIRYYLPDYKQGQPFPHTTEWPNSEYPEQIIETLGVLNVAQASVRQHTAIEYLAKARYEQLSLGFEKNESNSVAVLTLLAKADKKLGKNSKIPEYVKQHYPTEMETYNNLLNNL
ncbi:MAG: hypothetical protein HRT38_13520 [Alteromonadaceae bacterium]|nr:hypothetical protein [Alteromonadaceae bacterium]